MKTPPPSSFQLHWILAKGPFALRAQLLDGPFSLFSTEPTIRDTPRCQSHSKILWMVELQILDLQSKEDKIEHQPILATGERLKG